ncbi:hypothetical protein N7445_010440 [Penicillium cf. griseofulvum]|nr:hypothetical protein N7445_010440 [Penicillium cf. griseofulvum]
MPFYTLIQYFPTGPTNHSTQRYLMITPDQSSADILFRGFQDSIHQKNTFYNDYGVHTAVRPDPEIWVLYGTRGVNYFEFAIGGIYDNPNFPVANFGNYLGVKPLLQSFAKRDTLVSSYPLPLQQRVDSVNYGSFYIRNKHFSDLYWHVGESENETRVVMPSKEKRSKFRLKISGNDNKTLVMVNYDEIELSYFDQYDGNNEKPLYLSGNTRKWLTTNPSGGTVTVPAKFKMGAIYKGGFSIAPGQSPYIRYDGDEHPGGDIWELY